MPLIPEEQWRNKSAWEGYYQNYANSSKRDLHVDDDYFPATPLLGYGFAQEAFLSNLEKKRRILFLGNGIDREPLRYYYSGFDVTVIDISEKACDIFRDVANKVDRKVRTFLANPSGQINYSGSPIRNESTSGQFVYRPGGSLQVISADMFEWQPETKWHYIQNKLAFIAFTEAEQKLLLTRYYDWLEPSGQLQICYYYYQDHPFDWIVDAAKKIGFITPIENRKVEEHFRKTKPYRDNPAKHRKMWLEFEYQEYERKLLVKEGAKMLRIIFGSCL